MRPVPEDLQLIGPEELGLMLGRSPKSIVFDASQRPGVLPPRFMVKGTRGIRWRLVDVRAWMDRISQESIERAEAEQAARAKAIAWRPRGCRT